MFEYKSISFFNEYFSSLPDFKLSQEFIQEEKGENKNLFIGIMESVNTVHPMSIKIEIPKRLSTSYSRRKAKGFVVLSQHSFCRNSRRTVRARDVKAKRLD